MSLDIEIPRLLAGMYVVADDGGDIRAYVQAITDAETAAQALSKRYAPNDVRVFSHANHDGLRSACHSYRDGVKVTD